MIVYDKKAMLRNTRNDQEVECEVDNIKEGVSLDAFIVNTKIHMRWNGKTYVGNMAGLEFTTSGPTQREIKGRIR